MGSRPFHAGGAHLTLARSAAAAAAVAAMLCVHDAGAQAREETPWLLPTIKPFGPPRRQVTWDLNLEGGIGSSFADDGGFSGFGRVRGGVLSLDVNDFSAPMFSLGFFADGSNLVNEVAWGLQGEVAWNNAGFWGQLGVGLDGEPNPLAMAAVGWAIIGFETQVRVEPNDFTSADSGGVYPVLLGKLRIPIGIGAAVSRWNYPGRRRIDAPVPDGSASPAP